MRALLLFLLLTTPAYAEYITIPADPQATVVNQEIVFPCWYCLAIVSRGGGIYGHTVSIMDLHVISGPDDVAFPRALVARIESECAQCQPAAITAQAHGLSPLATVTGTNIEAYSQGRAVVSELNMGAANGGYVLDVVPVRMPDGTPSQIDAVMKIEGFGYDPEAARIGAIMDIKIRPAQGVLVIPATEGCTTVIATSDGRMREDWCLTAGEWSRSTLIDGFPR